MGRLGIGLLAVTTLAACVSSDSTVCGDGTLCPSGAVCARVTIDGAPTNLCVNEDTLGACRGIDDGTACGTETAPATCHGGACIDDQCGNGLVDATEACDDHNTIVGDGCASDCRSDETCGNGVVDPVKLVAGSSILNETCDDGNGLSHDGCSSSCVVEVATLTEVSLAAPVGLHHQNMAFDTLRGRVVMFGGQREGTEETDDVWTWQTVGWRLESPSGSPGIRMASAMTYDAARDRIVVFGGCDVSFNVSYDDTWEYDGRRWLPVASPGTGPSARFGAAMTHDPGRGIDVLFSGGAISRRSSPTHGSGVLAGGTTGRFPVPPHAMRTRWPTIRSAARSSSSAEPRRPRRWPPSTIPGPTTGRAGHSTRRRTRPLRDSGR